MDKKTEIIDSVFNLFAEKGYSVSMSDIAKEVNLKVPSLYSHFENKDEIIYIVLKKEIDNYFSLLSNLLDKATELTCEEALKTIYFTTIKYFDSLAMLRFWRNISLIQNKELKIKCRDLIRKYESKNNIIVIDIFKKGAKTGELKSDNFKGYMFLYLSMIQGILDGMLLYYETDLDMKDYAQRTWDAYWDGIKK